MPIVVRIDVELARRKMSVGDFAEQVGLTPANVARQTRVRLSGKAAGCVAAHLFNRFKDDLRANRTVEANYAAAVFV